MMTAVSLLLYLLQFPSMMSNSDDQKLPLLESGFPRVGTGIGDFASSVNSDDPLLQITPETPGSPSASNASTTTDEVGDFDTKTTNVHIDEAPEDFGVNGVFFRRLGVLLRLRS